MQRTTTRLNDAIDRIDEPVLRAGGACEHVMALHFDPQGSYERGIVRCIVRREGDVETPGFVDRSRIHVVDIESPYAMELGPELDVEGAADVVRGLPEYSGCSFLGFEDPNLWWDRGMETLHFYCTIPFVDHNDGVFAVYLGHAEGPGLDSLTMTAPVLEPEPTVHGGAKEVAIAPPSGAGVRYNLVESADVVGDTWYSVLRTAVAADLSGPWEWGTVALHPRRYDYDWCRGHVSTAPLLPRSFIDAGEGRCIGLLNGREQASRSDGRRFGTFSVGLLLYDYERGRVEWVSPDPLVRDPQAETVTFASAFRQVEPDKGVVYAHVDDSYVRAYLVDAPALAAMLDESVPDDVLEAASAPGDATEWDGPDYDGRGSSAASRSS